MFKVPDVPGVYSLGLVIASVDGTAMVKDTGMIVVDNCPVSNGYVCSPGHTVMPASTHKNESLSSILLSYSRTPTTS
jgi:hypothetical protein